MNKIIIGILSLLSILLITSIVFNVIQVINTKNTINTDDVLKVFKDMDPNQFGKINKKIPPNIIIPTGPYGWGDSYPSVKFNYYITNMFYYVMRHLNTKYIDKSKYPDLFQAINNMRDYLDHFKNQILDFTTKYCSSSSSSSISCSLVEPH